MTKINSKKNNKSLGGENKFKQSFIFIMFLFLLVSISASINYNIGGLNRLIVANETSTFLGEVRNIDDVNGTSRFLEFNTNNGTLAIAAFTATNNLNRSMIMGITGGNFSVASPILVDDQPFLFSDGGNDMAFGVGSANGFVWRNDLAGQQRYADTTNVLMTLDSAGELNVSGNIYASENLTITDFFFLSNDYSLPPGQNKILRRNSATKAVFGVQNEIAEASTDSGAGYVLNTSVGEYRIDLHSALDLNNPNDTVHHLLGANNREIWRLNPNSDSSFIFEGNLDSEIVMINRTGLFVTENLTIEGNYVHQGNVGFTGTCVNTTYSGGLAINCND